MSSGTKPIAWWKWLALSLMFLGVLGAVANLFIIVVPDILAIWLVLIGLGILGAKGLFLAPQSVTTPARTWNTQRYLQIIFALALVLLAMIILSQYLFGKPSLENVGPLQLLISFTLASLFPVSAIAYLLFQRPSKLRKLAGDFWLLSIDIRSKESKRLGIPQALECLQPEHYDDYFNSLEGENHVSWNYVAQSIPAVLITIFGLSLFSWTAEGATVYETIIPNNANILQALRFGFIGVYIYALQLVYRRYTTLDLQPSVYINCTLTIIAGLAFNFVAFEAIDYLSITQASPPSSTTRLESSSPTTDLTADTSNQTIPPAISITNTESVPPTTQSGVAINQTTQAATGLGGGILAIVAFSLGYFPYLAIRWFNRIAHTALGVEQRRADALSLGLIDGVSQFHETRLRDEGIDNLQNLAAARLDELLMNTRFSAEQVVDWVDQASLYLYLESGEIESFRRAGIRGLTDLHNYWERCESPVISDQESKLRASLLQSTPERLDALCCATKLGPNVAHIKNYWERAVKAQIGRASRWDRKLVSAFFIRTGKEKPPAMKATEGISSSPTYTALKDAGTWKHEETWCDDEWIEQMIDVEERVSAQIGKARVARQVGKTEVATAAYNKAIDQAPDRDDIRNELAWFYEKELGAKLKKEDLEEALKRTGAPDINPVITSSDNTTFVVGTKASFTITATGCPPPTLSKTAGELPLIFDPATRLLSGTPAAGTGKKYDLTFQASNGIGKDAVQNFILTINEAPVITVSPPTQTVCPGENVSFTASASGFPAPTVQWQESGGGRFNDINGATTPIYSFTPKPDDNGKQYRARFHQLGQLGHFEPRHPNRE